MEYYRSNNSIRHSPCILIVQLSLSPPKSSHCIVYPLIPDCTVNDMFDIILGLVEDKSVEKSRALRIGVVVIIIPYIVLVVTNKDTLELVGSLL